MPKTAPITDLPSDFHLLPWETLVPEKTTRHQRRQFDHEPSSLEQMVRLTGARSARSIGQAGPSIAALAITTSQPAKPRMPLLKSLPALQRYYSAATHQTPDHLRLYEVVFGRDSLRVAIDLISSYPALARATTLKLAELQGIDYTTAREEEPGRIVHEARDADDEIAQRLTKGLGWQWPYYGSVDATPEFIRTLTAYCRRSEESYRFLSTRYTDRSGTSRDMAYALDMAIEWIITRLGANPEGLLEYQSVLPHGIENQVWKDSWDAYHHADGTLANHAQGISSIEVQVTTYDALLDAVQLYERMYGDSERAASLRDWAHILRRNILKLFWTEDKGGYFVLGLDRDDDGSLRQMKIRTSNMGHVLNSRLLEGEDDELLHKREAVIRHILSPDMLNISGIRTLASDEVRFRPGAYHNGSVWLWDTHHIAKGLRRHGHRDAAGEIDRRLLHVVEATRMFPEYVRGDNHLLPSVNEYTITVLDSQAQRENRVEQPPQEVQAWTVAAILAIKKRVDRESLASATALDKLSRRLERVARLPRKLNKLSDQIAPIIKLEPIPKYFSLTKSRQSRAKKPSDNKE